MASSLIENHNSDRLGISHLLRPKSKPKIVKVYVESEEDISFWRFVLQNFENEQVSFEITVFSKERLTKGKNAVLKLVANSGQYLLLCVDSDYDYLLYSHYTNQEKITLAQKINEHNYVFQTYTYAIENLKCYAPSLHGVCVNTTLNDTRKLDFIEFMKIYSSIIYDLFIWNLLFYSKGEENYFSLGEFCTLIKILEEPSLADYGKAVLEGIEAKTREKTQELETMFPTYISEVRELAQRLENKGLNRENAYLFVQGHTIFDKVVLMLLKPICKKLKNEWIESIKRLSQNEAEKANNIAYYKNKVGKVDQEVVKMLANNTDFTHCSLFTKIKEDFAHYFSNNSFR